jgi:thiamine-monophosphate kinase
MPNLGEFELIRRYFSRPPQRAKVGVGDDCAILVPRPGGDLAVTTDMLIEGRHFLPGCDPARLGHKSLAVSLSDLAACAAEPLAFTLSLALPHSDPQWLAPFAQGLFALAMQHNIELVGGDTTRSVAADGRSPGPICISITAFGQLPLGAALLRGGAKPGDEIWVSGALGDARLALGHLRGEWQVDDATLAVARARMDTPTPRLALALGLRGVATAAIDVSDGFVGDLGHLLAASKVGAQINIDALPRSDSMRLQPAARQRACTLAGGDDYELVFTAPAGMRRQVVQSALASRTTVTRVGQILEEPQLRLQDATGQPVEVEGLASFDHFLSS